MRGGEEARQRGGAEGERLCLARKARERDAKRPRAACLLVEPSSPRAKAVIGWHGVDDLAVLVQKGQAAALDRQPGAVAAAADDRLVAGLRALPCPARGPGRLGHGMHAQGRVAPAARSRKARGGQGWMEMTR